MTDQSRPDEIELFQSSFELPVAARNDYLRAACGDDQLLRARVERLLEAHDRAGHDTFAAVVPAGEVPDVIGPYEVVRVLGEGGMGVVYEAEQRYPVRRRVALKIVKLGMDTRQVIARFTSERQALAAMDHPYVAKVFDAGQTVSGRPYFVMEIVRGEPLLDYCNRERLGLRERLSLFILVCQAVQHAHLKGVIHRDLKPSNLLVSSVDGQPPVPKVIDFGISKAIGTDEDARRGGVTRTGQPLGTPAYMSPEQAGFAPLHHAGDVDTRTDIYSLGVVLYELLTGSLPVDPSTTGEALFLARLSSGDLVFPRPSVRAAVGVSIPPDLDWIVMKALEPDRNRRYETALSLADDVARYLRDEPVAAGPPVLWYRARKFVRRHRVQVIAGAVAVAGLTAGAATATVGFIRATRAEHQARDEAAKAREVSAFLTDLFSASDPNVRASSTLRELLDRGAATIDGRLDRQPAVRASLFATMGHVYESLGMYKEAITLAEKAVAIDVAADSQDAADAAVTLGRSRQNLGDFDGARQAFERALAIRTRLFGQTHLEVATVLNSLGGLHSQLERYDASLDAHSRALAIQRALRGPDGLETTNSLRGMAIVHARRKDVERALDLDRQVLAIYRTTYGNGHALVGSGLHSVSVDLLELHRIEEARAAAEEGLLIRTRALGPDHPQTAFSHHTLGDIHAASNRFAEAKAAYREALRIRETALGIESPRTGDVARALGRLMLREGDAAGARPLLERALRIYEKGYGPGHSKTIGARADLEAVGRVTARQVVRAH